MSVELTIPDVGESIQEVQIGKWLKQEGDTVEQDEEVVELETDKASMDLPAPAAGVLAKILKQAGEVVAVGDVIAHIEESDGQGETSAKQAAADDQRQEKRLEEMEETEEADGGWDEKEEKRKEAEGRDEKEDEAAEVRDEEGEGRDEDEDEDEGEGEDEDEGEGEDEREDKGEGKQDVGGEEETPVTPAARRALREHGLTAAEVEPAGERIRPEDVERHVQEAPAEASQEPSDGQPVEPARSRTEEVSDESQLEQAVPMSLIRRRIAQRLVEAQQSAALLTTFNEIDMSAVIELRQEYQQQFEQEYGVELGYMPFFVKAAVDALRHFPELNAEIRDGQIVYRSYYHVGIAIGGGKGLVVPVLRFAERLSFAEIEEAINDFAERAGSNDLRPDDLEGGTFTITNGGVYGSLLSTPIVNPPQSGVVGMHAIQQRPVARQGQVVIRPMMYVALTYDHRIVDGREAVLFLKRLKEAVEEPARMLIEV